MGRKTRDEEAADWLRERGFEDDVIAQLQEAGSSAVKGPQSFEDLERQLIPHLASQLSQLKGTALVQAVKTVRALADEERAGGGPDHEHDPPIADVISGIASLPAERKKEILAAERQRLERELAAIDAATKETL